MKLGTGVIGSKTISVIDLALLTDDASQSSYTFAGASLGDAANDRLIVLRLYNWSNFNATRLFSGVTVAGNAATIHDQRNSFSSLTASPTVAVASIALAAGTTGDIVCSISGGNAANCAVHACAIYGLKSLTPHHYNGATTSGSTAADISTTLNNLAGGVQVVAAGSVHGAASHTAVGFTGIDSQIDTTGRFQRGLDVGMPLETARTLTSGSGTNSRRVISAASWR